MNEPKICPLLAAGDPGYRALPGVQCKGDLCAWAYEGGCAIAAIARGIDDLNEHGIIAWVEENE